MLADAFHMYMLGDARPEGEDPALLAHLRYSASLHLMSRQAHKPIFDLTAADGAIGTHAAMVRDAYDAFAALAKTIGIRAGIGQWATEVVR